MNLQQLVKNPEFFRETNQKWKKILEREKGERIAVEILDEIVLKAGDVVFEHYIQKRVVPFAVQQAKEELLTAINYMFFTCDEGEKNPETNPAWILEEGLQSW